MSNAPMPSSPAAMERGAYNRNSSVQESGSAPALPWFESAARAVDLPALPVPIVIADYGASQGHNSFGPMAAAIRALRERTAPEQAISVVHTDLPGNDFSALFQALASDPQSYLRADPFTFASAVGRSFYEQLLPAGSVTLGWSSWAVQWLSRTPAAIPDHVQVACSGDAAVKEQYLGQAAEDWRMFLHQRGRELHSGGRLIILTMGLTDQGDFGYRPVLASLYGALQSLVDAGFLKAEELRRMAIPTVGRSKSQLMAPFQDGRFEGLEIEQAEVFLELDEIWERYERDGAARAFAARWAGFCRASVLPTLALALDGASSEGRRTDFLDRVEQGMASILAEKPEKSVIPLASISLRKR